MVKSYFLTLLLSALSLSPTSRASSDFQFFFVESQGRFFLATQSFGDAMEQCQGLQKYALFINQKNGIMKSFEACRDLVRLAPAKDLNLSSLLTSNMEYGSREHFLNQRSQYWTVDVSNILPQKILKRTQENKRYDNICYNGALVHSGTLTLEDYSQFIADIDNYLDIPKVRYKIDHSQKSIFAEKVKISSHGLVSYRKSWTLDAKSLNQNEQAISSTINRHFSPGSVVCIGTVWDIARDSGELRKELSGYSLKVKAPLTGTDQILEDRGLHCMNMMTPDLIIETNLDSRIEFTTLIFPLRKYLKTAKFLGFEQIRVSYYQINHPLALAFQAPIDPPLRTAMRQHRRYYENPTEDSSIYLLGILALPHYKTYLDVFEKLQNPALSVETETQTLDPWANDSSFRVWLEAYSTLTP